ncbi:unnamed protein product [Ambrosiozyma monospora]|uniref:tRNA wybutosine-synthesizing protein 3 n=1 Tax=Ambrosiozyma monospora TaxID=43982 RepID=A0A9W7DL77_AMBMO|nr:unnamed protein product [Ambrosiozyma monospora]
MSEPFDQKKAAILSEIDITSSDNPDASPKGTIDELCIPIIKLINSHKDMFTTSSCSGRISVFVEGSKKAKTKKLASKTEEPDTTITSGVSERNQGETNDNFKIGAKGEGGHWLFVTHDDSKLDNWWKDKNINFENNSSKIQDLNLSTRYVLFKFEPLILHVKTRDFESASKLYTTAMNCGFRESGIGVNNIVAIRISIRLDIPIAYLETKENGDDEGRIVSLVTEDYLGLITKLGYDRFQENRKKLNHLYDEIEQHLIHAKEEPKKESKDERRERKRMEGLARRESVRKLKEQQKILQALKLANGCDANVKENDNNGKHQDEKSEI